MARIVIVQGAFNELWGPNELKARWLPAVRDGLWHHGVEVETDDVDVCFYGDPLPASSGQRGGPAAAGVPGGRGRHAHGDRRRRHCRAVRCRRRGDVRPHGRHGHGMMTEPDLRDRLRARSESEITADTRVLVAHSLGSVLSYAPWRHTTTGPCTRSSPSARRSPHPRSQHPGAGAGRRPGGLAGLGPALGDVLAVGDKAAEVTAPRSSGPGSKRSSSTTGTGPRLPSPTSTCPTPAQPWPPPSPSPPAGEARTRNGSGDQAIRPPSAGPDWSGGAARR